MTIHFYRADVMEEDILDSILGKVVYFEDCYEEREIVKSNLLDDIRYAKMTKAEWEAEVKSIKDDLGDVEFSIERDTTTWFFKNCMDCIELYKNGE